jgi:hypothetical protein
MNADVLRIRDDYVARLRRSMHGAPADLIDEAEREIVAHIEDAMAAREAPTVGMLLDVLAKLGSPEVYGRDLALYMMVDRGYRKWSLPDMFRSTAYWAFSTIVGGVVVLIFGALYLGGSALVVLGLFNPVIQGLDPLGGTLGHRPSAVLLLMGGAFALAGTTSLVRVFVGQYVRRARPLVLAGEHADSGWVERTSRRILSVAVIGLVITLPAGFLSGAYRLDPGGLPHFPPAFDRSPLAWLSAIGLFTLLLAPVIGLYWTALAERIRTR